ncbi:serine hydrolase [Actinokineospora auranticolor]|uniref:CubicO group peptidase (Beta-lactamase class C family) n=1 Tax=Actinokineospora auranticolor TaxID=155976 RepID=A0A2S6GKR4_9PSEU|nr:serine hydrolase [Actinokineospora auranticolor]PPK65795.1 CubicO group peptidase (beta-lactamase class C family) [Actinokineospora auranticolor]
MAGKVRTGVALVAVGLLAGGTVTSATPNPPGRFDRPEMGFAAPSTVLRDGPPASVGLDPAPIREADTAIAEWTRGGSPLYPGAVTLLAHNGVIVDRTAVGHAVKYADAQAELPADRQVPMRRDTIFDVASMSKLFTSVAVMCLVDDGRVRVGERVSVYLPEFGVNGKESITVQQLLTHTSGLEPTIPLWRDWPDRASRIKAVMDRAPATPPGVSFTYSDLNLITLGVLVERLSGKPLDNFVAERITAPLRLTDTGYNPPATKLDRIAATEFQASPPRGMVRGQVHDENAWALGGVAGHAGVFSTADDLAVLGQAILNGGTYAGRRILRQDTVRAMLTNYNTSFPEDAHGLGFELDQPWYMGGLSGPHSAGHTGFTGTSLVLDPASRSIAILLTNRVHPGRDRGSINAARQELATGLSRALAVRPSAGERHWSTGLGDSAEATLTGPALPGTRALRVGFDAFVDAGPGDELRLEATDRNGSWRSVLVRATGPGAPVGETSALSGYGHRSWWRVNAIAPVSDKITLRWRYLTDSRYTGRGVIVDRILVTDGSRMLLNGEKEPHLMRPVGWELGSH